jgi:hypothetical protein
MTISIADLQAASKRQRIVIARSLAEARTKSIRTAFLCHSHRDAELAEGFITLLGEKGCQVYVDWMDTEMPQRPTRETASRIQQKIVELDLFLFLATPNSMASRWCPWEIGYANGKKPIDHILVVPTISNGITHGSEYLDLYRHVEVSNQGNIAAWQPGTTQNGIHLDRI